MIVFLGRSCIALEHFSSMSCVSSVGAAELSTWTRLRWSALSLTKGGEKSMQRCSAVNAPPSHCQSARMLADLCPLQSGRRPERLLRAL